MITFITGNEHKVIEAENIFKLFGVELEHIDLGYMEPQGTLEDVARFGAKYACQELNRSVIVEDAGLFISALNGFPGTYSKFVQNSLGNQNILKLMDGVDDRYAEFRSVIGYCTPNSEPKVFLGRVEGQIAFEERGNLGFAYDPLFIIEEEGKTFGELTTEEKNQYSHRRNSLEKFINWYVNQDDE
ncbi:XTP/dITP diphosphatase [Methanobrevibacter ruminantium]|uniref:XTP/dITP diphosphatase n=1 Tax=Methanobrevibacter ruminantium TaxID=83816 RepID=UPI0026EC733D|nr:XTP/dITP diphosphatase [Methanobrevibacter ruminantium]